MPLIPISSRKHQTPKEDCKSSLFHATHTFLDKTLIVAKEISQTLAKVSSEAKSKI